MANLIEIIGVFRDIVRPRIADAIVVVAHFLGAALQGWRPELAGGCSRGDGVQVVRCKSVRHASILVGAASARYAAFEFASTDGLA